ncbi:MAG: FAD:protein FMN transferase [Bacteroidales bacterium]
MKNTVFILWMLMLFISCDNRTKMSFSGEAQGTYYLVHYYDHSQRNFQAQVDSLLGDFDRSVSLWVPGSVISRINRNEAGVRADTVVRALFHRSVAISRATSGYFDFTVGPLVNAWGFGFRKGTEPDSAAIDRMLAFVDYRRVALKDGRIIKEDTAIQIDFNAIAQGYSVDLVADFLEKQGIDDYLVDIGGEVYAHGRKPGGKPWVVGIEKPAGDPYDERRLEARARLENMALATSGSYRKFYIKDGMKYSHTIDPHTGYPVTHPLLSVSVLADDCATADGYATAFMVMGVDRSLKLLGRMDNLEAFFIYSDSLGDHQTLFTEGFEEVLAD